MVSYPKAEEKKFRDTKAALTKMMGREPSNELVSRVFHASEGMEFSRVGFQPDTITLEDAKAFFRSPSEPPWDDLDPAIAPIVKIFWEEGAASCQSCQGGPDHPYPEPTVQFIGGRYEGLRLAAIALAFDLQPISLRRVWKFNDGELEGPDWEMTFWIPGVSTYYRDRKKEEVAS
jgi:hypothetical protein